ncbi:guanine deaminase [Microbacterium ginsengiterrae]|uniref:Guanine deaminase n=1 Tax=Microbacterium ginsengiterrae TaxID=546115 RepID=A0A7W9CC48_9MICO|nr:nucleoside deaminase [Microbacterium ginsengiterrae]MBB5742869.1 guanine deaminase [Microbacterium ginsengiterrae]
MNIDSPTGDRDRESLDRTDREFLAEAVKLAVDNVADGGGPFGAVVVRDGEIVSVGQNRVTRDHDPSAHAEVVAIRAAGRNIGDFSLEGTTLYSSCEPCPMCMAASLWARVDRVVYAADRHDAAEGGFDDLEFYRLFETDRSEWSVPVESLRINDAAAPFEHWMSAAGRTEY